MNSTPVSQVTLNYSKWKDTFLRTVLVFAAFLFLIIIASAWSVNSLSTNITYLVLLVFIVAVAVLKIPTTIRGLALIFALFYGATNLVKAWGIYGEATMVYGASIVLAALIFERPVEYIVMGLASGAILVVAYLSINGQHILSGWSALPDELFDQLYVGLVGTWTDWIVYLVDMVGTYLIVIIAVRLLKREFRRILDQAVSTMDELNASRGQLEQRVAERTLEIRQAQAQSERQATLITTGADVARAATAVLDPDELIHQAVNLIQERFQFYYVGLFLLDEAGRYADLHQGAGVGNAREAVRMMKESGHRLEVGGASMVGWVCEQRQARIALDVGQDAVRFANPLLPETRSEMALPLQMGDRLIGVLDVQSTQVAAFGESDIIALQSMTDQITIALENARQFQRTQQALQERDALNRMLVGQGWQDYLMQAQAARAAEFALTGDATAPASDADASILRVPLELRGQSIGTLAIERGHDNLSWSEDEVAAIQAITQQVTLTLETARLLENAQRTAARERTVSEVTGRIRETLDMETMLRTATGEIRQALNLGDLVIRLLPPKADDQGK